MFYNYLLQSKKDGSWYTGYTDNLKRRIEEHNQGKVRSTKSSSPWELIYYEACLNSDDARRREGYIKTTQGKRMIKLRLKEYLRGEDLLIRNNTTG